MFILLINLVTSSRTISNYNNLKNYNNLFLGFNVKKYVMVKNYHTFSSTWLEMVFTYNICIMKSPTFLELK